MREIILGAILLFSVMSCSEDSATQDVITNKETSMKIGFKSSNSITNKNVKRGILPIQIDNVTIMISPKNYDPAVPTSVFDFNIVGNEDDTADNEFVIKNFAQGEVQIYAYTKTLYAGHPIDEVTSINKTTTEIFNEYNARIPVMGFYSIRKDLIAVAGVNNPVTIELLPDGYREISIFELSQELKDKNYTAKVGGTYNGLVSKTNNVVHYKNVATGCATGSTPAYIGDMPVEIYDETGEVIAKFNVVPDWDVKLGESKNTIYTITSDKIPAKNQLTNTIFAPAFESGLPVNKQI